MIAWSALHAALGLSRVELSYEYVGQAIDEHLVETDEIEWKADLPGKEPANVAEFAKDVAAMANTRGGLIVYGVAEERGSGAAKSFSPVDISEPARRRLRALAASNVHPMVGGLVLDPLQGPGAAGTGVLVMAIPASPDRPHTIGQQDKVGIPWRDGPETRWMRERDLERAYRDRFDGRAGEVDRLEAQVGEVRERLDPNRCWLVATASPRSPRQALLPRPSRADVGAVLQAGLIRAAQVAPLDRFGRQPVLRELGDDAARNPRIGLRRWVTFPHISADASAPANVIYVELHDDGAVTLAVDLDGWIGPGQQDKYLVPKVMLESSAADFVALVDAAASTLGVTGLFALRLDIVRFNKGKVLTLVNQHAAGNRLLGNLEVVPGSRKVAPFMPVLSELTGPADTTDLQRAAAQLALDAINQFGVESLTVLA